MHNTLCRGCPPFGCSSKRSLRCLFQLADREEALYQREKALTVRAAAASEETQVRGSLDDDDAHPPSTFVLPSMYVSSAVLGTARPCRGKTEVLTPFWCAFSSHSLILCLFRAPLVQGAEKQVVALQQQLKAADTRASAAEAEAAEAKAAAASLRSELLTANTALEEGKASAAAVSNEGAAALQSLKEENTALKVPQLLHPSVFPGFKGASPLCVYVLCRICRAKLLNWKLSWWGSVIPRQPLQVPQPLLLQPRQA